MEHEDECTLHRAIVLDPVVKYLIIIDFATPFDQNIPYKSLFIQ